MLAVDGLWLHDLCKDDRITGTWCSTRALSGANVWFSVGLINRFLWVSFCFNDVDCELHSRVTRRSWR